jgi:hypothetical protein
MAAKPTITNNQIQKIHTLISKLKWKDDWYRDNLCGYFGVESSTDLNSYQASFYIRLLEKEAIKNGVWLKPGDLHLDLKDREDMATPKQIRMINAMWSEISYYKGKKKRELALGKLLERIVKVSHINFLLKEDVKKVVNALRAMKQSKEKKELKKEA